MSSSTSLLDLLNSQQLGKDATANDLFNAGSPATIFARRGNNVSSGLNWFYYGGSFLKDGTYLDIPNNVAPLVLTANSNNYIEVDRAGTVSVNTTGTTPGSMALYSVVTGPSTVTSYSDVRGYTSVKFTSKGTETVTTTDVTMSRASSRCRYITVSGALTGNRNLVIPNDWEGIIFNNTTGAYTLTVKTSAGSGIVVAQTKRAILFSDGTNVVRITADA